MIYLDAVNTALDAIEVRIGDDARDASYTFIPHRPHYWEGPLVGELFDRDTAEIKESTAPVPPGSDSWRRLVNLLEQDLLACAELNGRSIQDYCEARRPKMTADQGRVMTACWFYLELRRLGACTDAHSLRRATGAERMASE